MVFLSISLEKPMGFSLDRWLFQRLGVRPPWNAASAASGRAHAVPGIPGWWIEMWETEVTYTMFRAMV